MKERSMPSTFDSDPLMHPDVIFGRENPNVAVINAAAQALGKDHPLFAGLEHAAAELSVMWARELRRERMVPVSWQVRIPGRPTSGWETCTEELYLSTKKTGRYGGREHAAPAEVRALGIISGPQLTREELVVLAQQAIAALDVVEGHIDTAIARCKADAVAIGPVNMLNFLTDAEIAECEAQRGECITSAVNEYAPQEFWQLLAEVKHRRAVERPIQADVADPVWNHPYPEPLTTVTASLLLQAAAGVMERSGNKVAAKCVVMATEALLAAATPPHAPGITAEWVLGYLNTDAPEDSREAVRNAFTEWAGLASTAPVDPEAPTYTAAQMAASFRSGLKTERMQLDGYRTAFFDIGGMLGLTAQPISPQAVWEGQMRPALKALIDARYPAGHVSVLTQDATNYCQILTALGMEEEGDPVEAVQELVAARDLRASQAPVDALAVRKFIASRTPGDEHRENILSGDYDHTAWFDHIRELMTEIAFLTVARPAPQPYSIDADPAGIRARVADAITGTLMVGAQGHTLPPAGHWAEPFWQMARAEATVQGNLGQVIQEAVDCFAAAESEGWSQALAEGDVERIQDLWNRRISYAYAALADGRDAAPAVSHG